jgi:hypothetical protein
MKRQKTPPMSEHDYLVMIEKFESGGLSAKIDPYVHAGEEGINWLLNSLSVRAGKPLSAILLNTRVYYSMFGNHKRCVESTLEDRSQRAVLGFWGPSKTAIHVSYRAAADAVYAV